MSSVLLVQALALSSKEAVFTRQIIKNLLLRKKALPKHSPKNRRNAPEKKKDAMAANRIRYWAPVVFFMAYIFYVSSQKGQDIPSLFAFQDIVYHFCIYTFLTLSLGRALDFEMPHLAALKIVCVCAVFGLLYGISDEFHQSFISGRSCQAFDVAIDTTGSFCGGILARWLR